MDIMEPIKILREAEIRAFYRQGEDTFVNLIQSLNQNLLLFSERIKVLEDRLAKNSRNTEKPPSSDGFSKPAPKNLRKRHAVPHGQPVMGVDAAQVGVVKALHDRMSRGNTDVMRMAGLDPEVNAGVGDGDFDGADVYAEDIAAWDLFKTRF
jgi:hypothetical protein